MACYHPIPAFRDEAGQITLGPPLNTENLQLPCGTCLGCRTTRTQHWALRCRLETADHHHNCVVTLTYDDEHVPLTLQKRDLQLWIKRLRQAARARIRYFACGEYGERHGRPHYHAILFGLPKDSAAIAKAWQLGGIHTDHATPAAISYIAGYVTKKIGWNIPRGGFEKLDLETGELYTWQPPFQLMSRRPGIGSTARKHYHSWSLFAVNDGQKLSVPRYYKKAWADHATTPEKQDQEYEKWKQALTRHTLTETQLRQQEKAHYARQREQRGKRHYE